MPPLTDRLEDSRQRRTGRILNGQIDRARHLGVDRRQNHFRAQSVISELALLTCMRDGVSLPDLQRLVIRSVHQELAKHGLSSEVYAMGVTTSDDSYLKDQADSIVVRTGDYVRVLARDGVPTGEPRLPLEWGNDAYEERIPGKRQYMSRDQV